jgi:hypothetical protein
VKRETYFVRGETVRVYKVSHTSARGTFTLLYDPTEHISITYAPGRTDEFESFVDLDVLPDNNYRLLLDVVPPEKAGYGKGTFLVDTRQPADGIISRALHLDTLAARITQETHALAAWDGCTQFPLDLERYHDLFTGITPIVKPLLYDYKGGAQRAATGTLERTKELIDKLFTRP